VNIWHDNDGQLKISCQSCREYRLWKLLQSFDVAQHLPMKPGCGESNIAAFDHIN